MVGIIEQIQRDAVDPNVSVAVLLRRVKLAAAKLGLEKVEDWVEHEMQGYGKAKIPAYRIVSGQPKALNPHRGWFPIGGSIKSLSHRENGQSVAEIEDLLARDAKGQLFMPYDDELVERLNEYNGTNGWNMALFVDRSALVGILDSVRNLILDWAIRLEKIGVTGTEFSFASEEKERVREAAVQHINIGSIGAFTGNLGTGNTSGDITASIDLGQVRELIAKIASHREELVKAGIDSAELDSRLQELSREVAEAQPEQSRLRRLLTGIRHLMENAGGDLIASGVITLVSRLLGGG